MPGGDAIGLRGIDFHVAGLRAMGAEVEVSGGALLINGRRSKHAYGDHF
jgi:UDP-N-acetylglucosamine 1-carboxyvinyltransferase